MRTLTKGMLAGVGLMLASSTSVLAQELTIFWAEWDPANYLQELVNEYEAETGVKVTVETTPWADFQTKAFTEFNAQGSAYDMIVGDSQWLGAASTAGHYVDLTDFVKENNVADMMAPATMKYYSEYPGNSGKYWSIPLEGDAVGWAYRKDWFEDPTEMANFKAKYGYDLGVPKDLEAAHRHRRVLLSSRREPLRRRHLHRQLLRRDGDGLRELPVLVWRRTGRLWRPTRSRAS